jgi:hypothetical protein
MTDLCRLLWCALIGLFRSRAALEAEILVLRHQLSVLRRKSPTRVSFSTIDRLVFAGLYRLAPGVLDALKIVMPETVIRWHRAGFRAYWRWKSRPRSGRPTMPAEIRQLFREISMANPLWGAPSTQETIFAARETRLQRSAARQPPANNSRAVDQQPRCPGSARMIWRPRNDTGESPARARQFQESRANGRRTADFSMTGCSSSPRMCAACFRKTSLSRKRS